MTSLFDDNDVISSVLLKRIHRSAETVDVEAGGQLRVCTRRYSQRSATRDVEQCQMLGAPSVSSIISRDDATPPCPFSSPADVNGDTNNCTAVTLLDDGVYLGQPEIGCVERQLADWTIPLAVPLICGGNTSQNIL